jgi:hypothetical protein
MSTVDSMTTHTPRDRPRGVAYGRVWVLIEVRSTDCTYRRVLVVQKFANTTLVSTSGQPAASGDTIRRIIW